MEKSVRKTLTEKIHSHQGDKNLTTTPANLNLQVLYFNTMRNGIEIILDDKLEQKKKELKRKETLENISKIKAKVK